MSQVRVYCGKHGRKAWVAAFEKIRHGGNFSLDPVAEAAGDETWCRRVMPSTMAERERAERAGERFGNNPTDHRAFLASLGKPRPADVGLVVRLDAQDRVVAKASWRDVRGREGWDFTPDPDYVPVARGVRAVTTLACERCARGNSAPVRGERLSLALEALALAGHDSVELESLRRGMA